MKTVPVTASCGIGRNGEQSADLFESVFVPNLQHDNFPLFLGKAGQRAHRLSFGRCFTRSPFEPSQRFPLAAEAAPKAAAIVQGPVAESSDAVVLGLRGPLFKFQ